MAGSSLWRVTTGHALVEPMIVDKFGIAPQAVVGAMAAASDRQQQQQQQHQQHQQRNASSTRTSWGSSAALPPEEAWVGAPPRESISPIPYLGNVVVAGDDPSQQPPGAITSPTAAAGRCLDRRQHQSDDREQEEGRDLLMVRTANSSAEPAEVKVFHSLSHRMYSKLVDPKGRRLKPPRFATGMYGRLNQMRDPSRALEEEIRDGDRNAQKARRMKDSGCIPYIARSKPFEYATLFVIFFNAIWIGVDTELNNAIDLRNADQEFIIVENFFCTYFTAEILIRFWAYRNKMDVRRDGWFIFDSVLVTFMIIETWIIPYTPGNSPVGGLGILRLLRLARLSRMARLMRSVPELLTLIKGLVAAVRSVASVLLFLFIIIYCYSIVFTGIFGGRSYLEASENDAFDEEGATDVDVQGRLFIKFGHLGSCMLTMLYHGTLLDNISGLVDDLRQDSVIMTIAFLAFIVLSAFTVLNMLIGILCEVTRVTAEYEKHKLKMHTVRDVLTKQFEAIDMDHSGNISEIEYDLLVAGGPVMKLIESELNIHKEDLADMKPLIFSSGEVGEVKEISFSEFLKLIIRLRPGEQAGPIDLQEFRKVLNHQDRVRRERVVELDRQLSVLVNAVDPCKQEAAPIDARHRYAQRHRKDKGESSSQLAVLNLSTPTLAGSSSFIGGSPRGAARAYPVLNHETGSTAMLAGSSSFLGGAPPAASTSGVCAPRMAPQEISAKARASVESLSDSEIIEELRRRMPDGVFGAAGGPVGATVRGLAPSFSSPR